METRKKISLQYLIFVVLMSFTNAFVFGQVSLESETNITNQGLYFDGNAVAPDDRLTHPDRTDGKYDYAFGRRITPHGDCITKYGDYMFLTWYRGGKSERHVMLTRINTKTKSRVDIEFPHRHTGFQNRFHVGESHNTIAVGVCPKDETVHLLYDMHAYSPTRPSDGSLSDDYFRYSLSVKNAATLPDDQFTLDKFLPKRKYLKQGESYTGLTYPDFFVNDNGDLLLKMRVGGNNNGKFQIAKYDGNSWSDWTDYNILNARSRPEMEYHWGLYGSMQYLNGKLQIGYSIRKNDNEFELNNGFFYSYSEDPDGVNNWFNYQGQPVTSPIVDPYEVFISEPADEVSGSVRISEGPGWTVTEQGDIHFMVNNVRGGGENKDVHTYKKAGDTEFTTSTNFPGGLLRSIGNDIYLIGLQNGRPIISKAEGGTNDWTVLYEETSGKTFRHGNIYIADGKLYYYLMENGTGNAQPIWLQVYDLGINPPDTAPSVQFTYPSNDFTVDADYDSLTVSVMATSQLETIMSVKLLLNDELIEEKTEAPFTWGQSGELLGLTCGVYVLTAIATDNKGNSHSTSINLRVNGECLLPSLNITSPAADTVVLTGYHLPVKVESAVAAGELERAELYLNDSLIGIKQSAPFEWGSGGTSELDGLLPGQYEVKVVVFANGGISVEDKFNLKVASAPIISLESPKGDVTVLREGYTFYIKVNASDPDGSVEEVSLSVNGSLISTRNTEPYEWGAMGTPNPNILNGLPVGEHVFNLVATDDDGFTSEVSHLLKVEPTRIDTFALPARFEAEWYSKGNGIRIMKHNPYQFLMINPQSYVEYIIDAPQTGNYLLSLVIDGRSRDMKVNVTSNGEKILTATERPNSERFEWETFSYLVTLQEGIQTLRISGDRGSVWTLDKLSLMNLKLVIEAEDYDEGESGVTYFDRDPGNSGGVYRFDDVDIFESENASNGHYVGSFAGVDWMRYTFEVPMDGEYKITYFAANRNRDDAFVNISIDSIPYNNIPVTRTFDWDVFLPSEIPGTISLSAGAHTMILAQGRSLSNNPDKIEIELVGNEEEEGEEEPICDNGNLIIDQNFDQYANPTQYTLDLANNDFDGIRPMTSGVIRGLDGNGTTWPHKNMIIDGVLRAEYLADIAGGPNGGFLFDKEFDGTEEAIMEYRVIFDKDFIWAYGGKLPGLGGTSLSNNGAVPAGCTQNTNQIENGFSARLMWRQSGAGNPARLSVYTYFPDRETNCGTHYQILSGLETNKWYTIKQHIKLNTPGSSDGILKMYIDNNLVLDLNNVLYRGSGKSNVKINAAIFNTYRGGGADDTRFHSPTIDYIYFDDFKVWTNCSNGTENVGTRRFFEDWDVSNNTPKIYPNPSKNHFTVDIGSSESASVAIYNMNGLVLQKATISREENRLERSKKIKPGIYFLLIQTSEGAMFTQKIIFE